MLAILLIIFGTALNEISSSVGKWNVNHKKESIYTLGFLNFFWGGVLFLIMILIKGEFIFDLNSLPLLTLLIVLEIAQTYSSINAVAQAERSTFGFLMVATVPLLMIVDIFLGYPIGLYQILGIGVLILGLMFLFFNHGLSKKGIGYVLFSTFNAVLTISIFKYLITNYNSVEAQQFITICVILLFLFIMAIWKHKENPLRFLFKKGFFMQSFSSGFAVLLITVAYVFVPASVATGAKRGVSVLFSIASGSTYFHEKHIAVKIASFAFVVGGLLLLAV